MTTVKDLKAALEGFDEELDVKFRIYPIHPGETVDGHEAGDITSVQKTYVEVTYYYPLVRKPEPRQRNDQSNRRQ